MARRSPAQRPGDRLLRLTANVSAVVGLLGFAGFLAKALLSGQDPPLIITGWCVALMLGYPVRLGVERAASLVLEAAQREREEKP